MRKALIFPVLLGFAIALGAQTLPLTREEYVKMLYALQRSPGTKADIIAALRGRGIDFPVNDGLRDLTRSKGSNDAELNRALEEAGRRKADPVAAKFPDVKEAGELLEKTRANTLAAVEEMPDFVVKQQIERSMAFAGTGNFRPLDRLVVAVSYRTTGEETYKILAVNGLVRTNPEEKGSYEEAGGTSSTGEFVTVLSTIFKPESLTKFEAAETDVLRGRKAIVYSFSTDKEHAKELITATGYSTDSTIAGMQGRVWVDRQDARVLRIESDATDIPRDFIIRSAKRNIDYDWVSIAGEKYLLPSLSEVRLTDAQQGKGYETRNVIKFKEYKKYGSEVKILDDDIKPEDTKKPN